MERIAKYLILLFVFASFGLLVELVLLGHYEDSWQWTPIILLGVAAIVGLTQLAGKGKLAFFLFRLTSLLMIISGFLGVYLHFEGNKAFELEMYPDLTGWELFWKTITGATPTLSPGVMILLGFIGWIYIGTKKLILKKAKNENSNI